MIKDKPQLHLVVERKALYIIEMPLECSEAQRSAANRAKGLPPD